MMRLSIRITQKADGGYRASCPAFPGCVTTGHTKEQACESIDEAIRGYLASIVDFVPERITDEIVLEV